MSIVEEKHDIHIDVPTFNVDNVLHEQIPHPLPRSSFSMSMVAPPGSGKTSLLTSFITQASPPIYKGVFDRVFLLQPQASFSSLENNPFKGHPSVYHEMDLDILNEIQTEIDNTRKSGKNSLVIIDDFMAELKNKELQQVFVRWIANRRHQKMSIIFLTQTFRSIPLNLRKNIGNWIFFKPSNKREIESIGDEIGLSKHDFEKYYNYVFPAGSERHQFMYIDANTNVYIRFAKLSMK
jgi:type IV secretory pathway VirB4 component